MRKERKVAEEKGVAEEPRLEELSDEDLEVVAGGCTKPGNSSFGLFTSFLNGGEGWLNNHACH